MRTTSVKLGGKEYLLCFSVRVSKACSERYGSVANIADALGAKDEATVLDETVWLFSMMANAGHRYAKFNGFDPLPPSLTEEEILDNFDMPDFAMLVAKVKEAISAGSATGVETQSEGNAEATRAE